MGMPSRVRGAEYAHVGYVWLEEGKPDERAGGVNDVVASRVPR